MSKDRSEMIDKQIAALKSIGKGKTVEAGWFESDRYGSQKNKSEGMAVAQVARIQEFGAVVKRGKSVIIIPARPFMRSAWQKFRSDRKKIQAKIAKRMIEKSMTPEQALGQIGLLLEGYIAGSIRDGGWQKNADSTVAKKGFDSPLIDSGHMWKTVSSKVT